MHTMIVYILMTTYIPNILTFKLAKRFILPSRKVFVRSIGTKQNFGTASALLSFHKNLSKAAKAVQTANSEKLIFKLNLQKFHKTYF